MSKKLLTGLSLGLVLLIFSWLNVADAMIILPAVKLKITATSSPVNVSATSGVFTIEAQNSLGLSANVSSTTRVNLVSSSGTGVFSSSPAAGPCSGDWGISQVTIASGTAHKSFCYKDDTVGTPTLTVSDDAAILSSDSQIMTIMATTSPDTEAPIITLLGSNPVDITVGDVYVDAGATATDAVDGSVPVVATGTVDVLTVGTYTIVYTATDAATNTATTTRIVNVKAKTLAEATSTPSHHSGSSIVKINFALASTTGQVLGTSTEKAMKEKVLKRKLTQEEKRVRLFKKKLNHIKIAIYDLKHPQFQVQPTVAPGTSTQVSSAGTVPLVPTNLTVSDSGEIVGTGTKATTTTKKKPFWKLW